MERPVFSQPYEALFQAACLCNRMLQLSLCILSLDQAHIVQLSQIQKSSGLDRAFDYPEAKK